MEQMSSAQIDAICRQVVQELNAPNAPMPPHSTDAIKRCMTLLDEFNETLTIIRDTPTDLSNSESMAEWKNKVMEEIISIQDVVNLLCSNRD